MGYSPPESGGLQGAHSHGELHGVAYSKPKNCPILALFAALAVNPSPAVRL